MCRTISASLSTTISLWSRHSYPSGGKPPIHMPFFFEAAILSRIRSPVTSRFELSKGQQHIEGQPPHRARGVELLGHRHERGALGVEDLDQLGKIGERAGQPVDLVDDNDV